MSTFCKNKGKKAFIASRKTSFSLWRCNDKRSRNEFFAAGLARNITRTAVNGEKERAKPSSIFLHARTTECVRNQVKKTIGET